MNSAAVYLTIGALLMRITDRRALKVYSMGVAMLLVFLIGVSRLYLGVHYPTDVLAGWVVGMSWAILCWLVERWIEHRSGLDRRRIKGSMLADSRLRSSRHSDRWRPSTCILGTTDVTMAHETILLVEDEPAVRQLFVTALTRAGYTVLEAANGEEGIAIFDRHAAAIDLLMTDIRMPHMTGDELARKLRERRH